MKRLSWINIVLLALVIALALFAYFRPSTVTGYRLSALDPAIAKHIEIAFAGSAPAVLERAGAGQWWLSAPFMARADDFQVQNVLAILGATTKERLPAQNLQRFDLAAPQLRVTVDSQRFAFGAINELTREQYVLTQSQVYLIRIGYFAALPVNIWQLISRQLFADDETPAAFDLPDFKLMQQNGKWTLSPLPKAGLSQDDFNRWVDNWRYASALAIQPASHRKPLATIKIGLKNGAAVQLMVLQRTPQLVFARGDRPGFEYQFTNDIAQQLLTPPGNSPKPATGMNERK